MLMDDSLIDSRIKGTWFKLENQKKMSTASLTEIKEIALIKGLDVISVTEIKFGSSTQVDAVLLETTVGNAIFPRNKVSEIEMYQRNIMPFKKREDFWRTVDWFVPPYISNGELRKTFNSAGVTPGNFEMFDEKTAQHQFDTVLSDLYTLSNIVPITLQIFPESEALSPHLPIIKEAIISFYSGMQVVAIAALIPIIENLLKKIIGEDGKSLSIFDSVNRCIDMACANVLKLHINGADWIPLEYREIEFLKVTNERIFILQSIRAWLLNSFYADDARYDKYSGFNRHHFAHALSNIWQNKTNFFRSLGLLQALAFVECFALQGSNISIFNPEPDERSESFHAEIISSLIAQKIKREVTEKFQSENKLPFNVLASNDGWLMHASILSEKMNEVIVASLRDKGWQCFNFGDPIKEGEYVTVEAQRGDERIKIALLYACATSNKIYKELAKSCDYILFKGSPYYIEEFARDVDKPVMPLNAWIAP